MDIYNSTDDIIACSTGDIGNTAIAVIRLSGDNFLDRINDLFDINLLEIKPRYAYFCTMSWRDSVIDELVLTFYKNPHSYNGEDVLELSVHGNQINIRRIIDIFCDFKKFRRAKPGEFTYRALQNNKLSLSQVEGLDLLLNANSIFSLDQGFSLLSGSLQESFRSLHDSYLKHRSCVEFGFDFLEDIGEKQHEFLFKESLNQLKNDIYKLHNKVSNQKHNLIKPEITLFGPPNSGKSTLFNILLDSNRALVSNTAGTTRDYLSEDIFINGNFFSLVDTAGLRVSDDAIESAGVEVAKKIISTSFYRILVINPFEFDSEYFASFADFTFDLLIFTHMDITGFEQAYENCLADIAAVRQGKSGPIEPSKSGPMEPSKSGPMEPSKSGPMEPSKSGPIEPSKSGPIEPSKSGPIEPSKSGPIEPSKFGPIEPIICSLVSLSDSQKNKILNDISLKFSKLLDFDPILIERHSDTINEIYLNFCNYHNIVKDENDMAIIASELSIVGHCISELIGIISPDDVLHNIFDNFCIGK